MYDAMTGRELYVVAGPAEPVTAGAFSPDGKRLAVVRRQQLAVCDLATGETRPLPKAEPAAGAEVLAFSPDGKRLAVAGYFPGGPLVKVLSAETGAEEAVWRGLGGRPSWLEFWDE